jgi:hypothetical protein
MRLSVPVVPAIPIIPIPIRKIEKTIPLYILYN